MGRFSQRKTKQLPEVKAEVTRPADVETVFDTSGMRFLVSFSFRLPQGKNNFNQLTELVDSETNDARMEILRKVANKLGVKVNFEN